MKSIRFKFSDLRVLSLSILVVYSSVLRAKDYELFSPNKEIKVVINFGKSITYDVYGNDQLLLKDCSVKLHLKDQVLGLNSAVSKSKHFKAADKITPVVALKNKEVDNEYNGLLISFKENFQIEFRAFNDGIAYRFITNLKGDIEVIDEEFLIGFPGEYLAHLQQTGYFKTAYENPYSHKATDKLTKDDEMSTLPVLIDTRKGYKMLISEADLFDYPCMFLKSTGGNNLQSVFPKCPTVFGDDGDRSVKLLKHADYIAKTSGTRNFPWRYFVITTNDCELAESQMTLKLSQACQIENHSWIKPGQVSWEWWNDASPYGVDFVAGYNLETYKYFIDFASKYGIEYIIMDEGWAKSTLDPYTPNPDVDLFELLRYGKEKNVGIVLWLTWLTVENNFELFKKFHEWGVKGVKIDFMERSDQWMVNYYERVAVEAAKHKLFVDFHGSFKPAGLEYRYPNVLSYEGVLGMEQMDRAIPDNSLFLPFMRNAVGPMDYTPGAMLSMQPEVFCGRRPNSASIGTRAYQLALFVAFESGLQMLADNPTNYYRESECTEFITQVPTTWDETKVLYAEAGEYYIVAKRKGNQWFIGGIVNGKENIREFEIDMNFLDQGRTYTMTSFEDGINANRQAMDYKKRINSIKKTEKINIKIIRNGGWAAIIK